MTAADSRAREAGFSENDVREHKTGTWERMREHMEGEKQHAV